MQASSFFRRSSRPPKGYVLVFSLIVLSFLLIAGLSLATVMVVDLRSAGSTDRSTLSFQASESAAELMLERIYKGGYEGQAMSRLVPNGPSHSCNDGVFTGAISSATYRITFYRQSGNDLVRMTSCSNTNWRNEVVVMRSEGIYGNTVRAVSLGIKPVP